MSDDGFTEASHLSIARTGFDTLPEGFQGGRVAYEMSQPIQAVSPSEFDPDTYADNLTEVMAHATPVPLFVSRAVERVIVDYCDVHGLPVPRMAVYSDLPAEIAHDPTENPRERALRLRHERHTGPAARRLDGRRR